MNTQNLSSKLFVCLAVYLERETFPKLDDKAGAELARELDFNEAGIGTFQRLRRAGGVTGHGAQCGSPRGLE